MHVGRLLAARTGSAAARALESSARALHRRRRHWTSAAATSGVEEQGQQPEQQQDTLRATLRDLPGPVASALADELLLCGALSASVDEFRPPGGAEQKLFGARGRDGGGDGNGGDGDSGSNGGSFPSPSDSAAVFWDRCTLTAIFEKGADVQQALRQASLQAGLDDASTTLPAAELSEARASEWLDALRGAFSPVFVEGSRRNGEAGRGLWILPEGCSLPPEHGAEREEGEENASSSPSSSSPSPPPPVVVRLTPGLAFGTGDHPTTRMCLRWLATEEVTRALRARGGGGEVEGQGQGGLSLQEGASLLDFGTGSGVLAAAAIALGCRSAVGTDVDPLALTAAAENAALNADAAVVKEEEKGAAVAAAVPLLRTVLVSPDPPGDRSNDDIDDPVGPPGSFDVVVANILQGPLLALAPSLARFAAPGAVSGVLASQAGAVAAAFAASGVDLDEFDREPCDGGGVGGREEWWVCLSGRKRL